MNYLEIVLQGYFNENNRDFLDKYFFREFKKAEKEHFFEADEFFNGCFKIVDILKENYKKQYFKIQSELNKYLVSVKKEDRDNEFIQQKKEEIEYLKLNGNTNFKLNNGKNVVLKIEEINYINNAIEQAFEKTQSKIEQLQNQSIKSEIKPIKYNAKEYGLAYIFDLWANNQQVPQNRVEGGLNSKEIKKIGSEIGFDKPDTFYRAVKSLLVYDLNKPTDLQNISKDWLNAVRNLSTNWVTTEQYLKDKKLIEE